jgi:hypothetical protein
MTPLVGAEAHKRSVPFSVARETGVLLPASSLQDRSICVSVWRKNKLFSDTYLGGCAYTRLFSLAYSDDQKAVRPKFVECWLPLNTSYGREGEVITIYYYSTLEIFDI